MAGILNWHRKTRRYDEAELRHHPVSGAAPLSGPTGIGTSAAHIATLVG
jgi:germacradienol/geosmin synthase